MSKGRELHRLAMELLAQADVAALRNERRKERKLLEDSLALESEAAMVYLDKIDLEPTRSQLFKGAALIALRLSHWRRAEQLVALGLSGNPTEVNAEELRNLLEDIHFKRHLLGEHVQLDEREIDLAVTGNAVGYGIAEKDEVFRRVDILETLLVRTAERQRKIPFRAHGRPSAGINQDVKIYLEAVRPGSFGIRIRVGSDQKVFDGMDIVPHVVSDALTALAAFEEGGRPALEPIIPQDDYRTNFATVAREMMPDGNRVKAVVLSSKNAENLTSVSLRKTKREVKDVAETGSKPPSGTLEVSTQIFDGELVMMDSTSHTEYAAVRAADGTTTKFFVPNGIAPDVFPLFYKARVRVSLRPVALGRFQFVDIDRID